MSIAAALFAPKFRLDDATGRWQYLVRGDRRAKYQIDIFRLHTCTFDRLRPARTAN